jgi:hypothetical protein
VFDRTRLVELVGKRFDEEMRKLREGRTLQSREIPWTTRARATTAMTATTAIMKAKGAIAIAAPPTCRRRPMHRSAGQLNVLSELVRARAP